jgi:RNA polymerase sigma-70 factor, ECF subfamily
MQTLFARHRTFVYRWLLGFVSNETLAEDLLSEVADPADDPEAALQEKHRSELLRRALSRLSSEHRKIIDLVYYHEKSIAECAQILGIPAATVKTRMFYARRRLAELVKDA